VNLIRIAALIGAAVLASPAAFAEEGARIPALSSWSGFYVGVTAGGAWYNGGSFVTSSNVAAIIPSANIIPIPTSTSNSAGFTAGGLTGFNYQIGGIVLGAETDFNYIDLKSQRVGSSTITLVPALPGATPIVETLSAASYNKVDWYGTMRARFGFVSFDRLLLYGTGGMAYGKVETSKLESNTFSSGITNRIWQGNSSEIKLGWTAGAGAEYALTPQVTLRTEYLYVDLGNSSVVARFQGTDPLQSQIYYTASRDTKFSLARAGISTRF
jgi:outer membrane immunogenic protein